MVTGLSTNILGLLEYLRGRLHSSTTFNLYVAKWLALAKQMQAKETRVTSASYLVTASLY